MSTRFRLHSVLRLRQSVVDERKAELGQAVSAEAIVQQQIEEAQAQLSEIEQQLRDNAAAQLDVDHLMALRRYQAESRHHLGQLQDQQEQVKQEIERRQIRLAESKRELQVMEKLEAQFEQHERVTQLQREQLQLDEFSQKRKPSGLDGERP